MNAVPYFTRVTPQILAEARSWIVKPCCGYDCDKCSDNDAATDALSAGIEYGFRYAAKMIASQIRDELVCCPPQVVDYWRREMGGRRLDLDEVGFHGICYWGEMAARLADDPHSLLESPYECAGYHPGPCWNARLCVDRKHPICDDCSACRFCERDECCRTKGTEAHGDS